MTTIAQLIASKTEQARCFADKAEHYVSNAKIGSADAQERLMLVTSAIDGLAVAIHALSDGLDEIARQLDDIKNQPESERHEQ